MVFGKTASEFGNLAATGVDIKANSERDLDDGVDIDEESGRAEEKAGSLAEREQRKVRRGKMQDQVGDGR